MRRLPLLALLFLALGLGLTWLLHTNAALHWALAQANQRLPLQLEYDTLEGTVAGPMNATGLVLQLDGVRVEIGALSLDWWIGDLVRARLNIKTLHAADLTLHLDETSRPGTAPQEAAVAPALPEPPLTIALKDLRLVRLSVVNGKEAAGTLEALEGSLLWRPRGLELDIARLEAGPVHLSGNTRVNGRPPYAARASLQWRLSGLADETLAGRSTLGGTLARLETRSVLASPARAELTLAVETAAPGVRLSGRLDAPDLRLQSLDAGWPDVPVTLDTGFQFADRELKLDGSARWADWTAVVYRFQGLLEGERLEVGALELSYPDAPGRLHATGHLALAPDADSRLMLDWAELDAPLGEGHRLRSTGTAVLDGHPGAYRANLDSQNSLDGRPPFRLTLATRGNLQGADIERLEADGEAGKASLAGRLDWEGGLRGTASVTARDLDPASLYQGASGRVNLEAALALETAPDGPRLTVNLDRLDGQVDGHPLDARGRLQARTGALRVERLDIRSGEGTLSAAGTLDENLDFRLALNDFDPAGWLPGLGGRFNGDFRLDGPARNPRIQGSLQATAPRLGDWQARSLAADLAVDLAADSESTARVDADDLQHADRALGKLVLDARGLSRQHSVTLALTGQELGLQSRLEGGYHPQSGWAGRLVQLQAEPAGIAGGPWMLSSAADVTVAEDRFSLQPTCLVRLESRVCLEAGQAPAQPLLAALQVQRLPLSALHPLVGETVELDGRLDGNLEIQLASAGQLTGSARLAATQTTIALLTAGGGAPTLAIPSLELAADADAGAMALQAHVDLGNDDVLDARLSLTRAAGAAGDWPAAGEASLRLGDLSRYAGLLPNLDGIAGSLEGRLQLAGSLENPSTSGQLSLEQANATVPELGLQVSNVTLDLQGNRDNLLLTARAGLGGGEARLDGEFKWVENEPVTRLHLSGEDLLLVDLPKINLTATPDVTLNMTGNKVSIKGRVQVPRADIQPVDLGNAVRASSDVVIVDGSSKQQRRSALRVSTDMAVELGNRVHFTGYGLSARVGGTLRLRGRPGRVTTARGELNLREGKYKLYGMDLGVDRGQLVFAGGPLEAPGLSLRASRNTGDVMVGVDVGGTLLKPTLTLFSTPPLPQSEIVAYLMTGKPMSSLDSASSDRVSAAGDALALAGGNLLSGEIGARVGLDELALQTEGTTGGSALVLGKYLSPRLYVSYGIGLYEAINTLRLRYQINKSLSIQTESGVNQSVDLFWSHER